MRGIDLSPRPDVATRLLAGVTVPDTPLISRAIEFACETCFIAPVADHFPQRGTNSSAEVENWHAEF